MFILTVIQCVAFKVESTFNLESLFAQFKATLFSKNFLIVPHKEMVACFPSVAAQLYFQCDTSG